MNSKLLKNYGSILLYQLVTILTPLLTTPYISRVFGPETLGLEAYLYSFIQLFSLVILLGLPTYASKKIAETTRQNTKQLFSEFVSFQLILTGTTSMLYILFICYFNQYKFLLLLYLVTLISTGLDTSWYFVGKEKISAIMLRNIVVKISTVIATFIFVKTSHDLWVYILINGLSLFLGQLLTGTIALKEVKGFVFVWLPLVKHIRSILLLFVVPSMLILTLSINKLLLESFNGTVQVGIFNQSYKLYAIGISFISALTSVLMPKMTKYYSTGDTKQFKKYMNFSIRFISGIALPLTVGIIVMAPQFIPWFLGKEFSIVSNSLKIVALSFVVKGLSDVIGIQYLVVTNKNKEYAWAVISGAVTTISTCYLFLRWNFQSQAPAIGLLLGTCVALLIELYHARKVISICYVGKCLVNYLVLSVVMGFCIISASIYLKIENIGLSLITQLMVGFVSYGICLLISKDPVLYLIKRKKSESR